MKLKTLILSSCFFVAPIFAAPNFTLPANTGMTADGFVAKAGSIDANYTAGNKSLVYVLSAPNAAWAVPNAAAGWISMDSISGIGPNNGHYTEDYSVTFNIADNIDPTTFSITGAFAADDKLNNIFVNNTGTGISASNAFASLHTFTLTGFVRGQNTIDFNFTNTTGMGGLLVEFTGASTAPEPASYALIGLGLAGIGLLRKKLS